MTAGLARMVQRYWPGKGGLVGVWDGAARAVQTDVSVDGVSGVMTNQVREPTYLLLTALASGPTDFGDYFLVVPVPTIPTTRVCGDHVRPPVTYDN